MPWEFDGPPADRKVKMEPVLNYEPGTMGGLLRDDDPGWSGFQYLAQTRDILRRHFYPSFEERKARLKEEGWKFCSCSWNGGRLLVVDPNCDVHHGERRGVRYR